MHRGYHLDLKFYALFLQFHIAEQPSHMSPNLFYLPSKIDVDLSTSIGQLTAGHRIYGCGPK